MEIIGSLALAIIQSILFYGKEIGISMLLFFSIGNGIIYYILNKKNRIKNKNGFLLIISILLLSSTYFIFANKTFYIANIFILIILNLMMYVIVTNKKNYLTNYFYNTFKLLTDIITGYKYSIEYTKEKSEEHIKGNHKIDKDNIKKIAISGLIVFAIVGVVIILLASADSIFAGIFTGIKNIFRNINIGNVFRLILRLVIIVVIYFLFLSFILNLQKEYDNEEKNLKNNDNRYCLTIKMLLITLNIVYLVFCFIQVKSLFAKINIDETFNYANYARTGFFELMFVSFINFVIIIVSNRYNENKEKLIKILNLFLVIFTIIIAISSMYRMHMYEMEYGLTYLRIFVYIILLTEIATFIPITAYIFNEKFDFVKWSFAIVLCVYCGINYMNIEKIIVNKNINRDISSISIDYQYLSRIVSEDSYDILEEKLKEDNIESSEKLELTNILLKLVTNSKEMNWQEFNISKYKMQEKNINTQKLREEILDLGRKITEEKNY